MLPAVTIAAARCERTSSAQTESDELRLPRSTLIGGSSIDTTSGASTRSSPLGALRKRPSSRRKRLIGPTSRTGIPSSSTA